MVGMQTIQKQRAFALLVGLLMIFSVAGYAQFSVNFTGAATRQQPEQQAIPLIVDRPLTGQEISQILGSGRVVIESVYNKGCGDCRLKDLEARNFATRYQGFVILESVQTDVGEGFEKFQMVGRGGQIIDLEKEEISQDRLLDLFGTLSLLTPRELIAREIAKSLEQQAGQGQNTSAGNSS